MMPERWEKIEQLFHSAAERTGEERAAYLEGACAGDAVLRQEVESLLAQDASGRILNLSVGALAAGVPVADA